MDIQKELTAEFERETAKTRKLLDAIPADVDLTWKPHEKSMELGKLAEHVAGVPGGWAIEILTKDRVEWDPAQKSAPLTSKAALLEQFDKEVAATRTALAHTTADQWDSNWKFVYRDQAWLDDSKYVIWRDAMINHLIHHRAQLGVYLRLLDHKIPGMYGPSADES